MQNDENRTTIVLLANSSCNQAVKILVRFYVIKNLVFSLGLTFAIIGLPSVAFAAESDPPTLTSFSIDKNVVDVGEIDQAIKFTVAAEDESGVDWSNPDTKLEFNDPSGKS